MLRNSLLPLILSFFLNSFASADTSPTPYPNLPKADHPTQPLLIPQPPKLNVKGYLLMDAYSGRVLAGQNAEQPMEPASLTKMMTSYVASQALRSGRIHLDDPVLISEKSWRTGGSKMFVKVGDHVNVRDLLQGIIVQSGNDACIAMAEHVAGSEDAFVDLMNQAAKQLGMLHTHFMDSTGLPDPNHFSTPYDLALLGRALIVDFPEDYKWYSQKWFVYNGIRQPNRNRLLWRDPSVDGIKTGHTDEAGFCLVASAQRGDTRLISVVMGAPSDAARADDSQNLLNYGFHFFQSHKLYPSGATVQQARVWMGKKKHIPIGVAQDVYVTLPIGQFPQLKKQINLNVPIKAPVKKGQTLGHIYVILDKETLQTVPLIALEDDPKGGFFTVLWDRIGLFIAHFRHTADA